MEKQQVILHTGGNLGARYPNLKLARRHIHQCIGPITRESNVYQTQAWGVTDQPDFLNQALLVETTLSPWQVLKQILLIEQRMGRKRTDKWTARLIDIDLLFYEDEIINTPDLIVPHPYLHLRNFVLAPLVEIAPQQWHPILHSTAAELYEQSTDPLKVCLLEKPVPG
jgi:2-amino-4-hydroxy-6-hydroxymethyldihydropteridine diphosphokinase